VNNVLPAGTVSIVFTDIESSTERWEKVPDAMRTSLTIHDQIIRNAVDNCRGQIIKHTGDGFALVFASATDAVSACLTAQAELREAPWPDSSPLRVRMGINTGPGTPTRGDYFGPTINRAARVEGAANGAQILCTGSTIEALGLSDDDSGGTSFTVFDRGRYELRGVGVQQLFVVATGHDDDDDQTVRANRIDVPRRPNFATSLVGREEDLSKLERMVDAGYVVSIIGLGGCGKTRLAAEFLEHASWFKDSYWVSLADLDQDGDPASSIVSSLGLSASSSRTDAATVAHFLDGADALLVIDDCDRSTHALGKAIEEILAVEHPPSILITSRLRLGIDQERVIQVGALDDPASSHTLFVNRVLERDPSREFDAPDNVAIATICERLDHIPLAIELAAARCLTASPEDVLRQLSSTAWDTEYGPLQAALNWSYAQLDPRDQGLLDRLSVFAGPFTAAAATEVVGADATDIDSRLARLEAHGLVKRVTGGTAPNTYFHLLTVVGEFGRNRLSAQDQLQPLLERHGAYFADFAIQAGRATSSHLEQQSWSELRASWPDVRATTSRALTDGNLDRAGAIVGSLFYFAGYAIEQDVTNWALQFCDTPGAPDHPHFGAVAGTGAFGLFGRAELQAALELAQRGLTSDPVDRDGYCRIAGVIAAINLGRQDIASELLADWFAHADQATTHSSLWANGWTAVFHAWNDTTANGSELATKHAMTALELAEVVASPSARAASRWLYGTACGRQNPTLALDLLADGLSHADQVSARHLIVQLIHGLRADLFLRTGDRAAATEACIQGLAEASRNGWLVSASHLLGTAATVLAETQRAPAAARLIGAMRASGQAPRRRAAQAVDDSLGASSAVMQQLGQHLSLRAAASQAIDELEAARQS